MLMPFSPRLLPRILFLPSSQGDDHMMIWRGLAANGSEEKKEGRKKDDRDESEKRRVKS
jgi:hypothetical protein